MLVLCTKPVCRLVSRALTSSLVLEPALVLPSPGKEILPEAVVPSLLLLNARSSDSLDLNPFFSPLAFSATGRQRLRNPSSLHQSLSSTWETGYLHVCFLCKFETQGFRNSLSLRHGITLTQGEGVHLIGPKAAASRQPARKPSAASLL